MIFDLFSVLLYKKAYFLHYDTISIQSKEIYFNSSNASLSISCGSESSYIIAKLYEVLHKDVEHMKQLLNIKHPLRKVHICSYFTASNINLFNGSRIRYFIIDQQIARLFLPYVKCLYHPLPSVQLK